MECSVSANKGNAMAFDMLQLGDIMWWKICNVMTFLTIWCSENYRLPCVRLSLWLLTKTNNNGFTEMCSKAIGFSPSKKGRAYLNFVYCYSTNKYVRLYLFIVMMHE